MNRWLNPFTPYFSLHPLLRNLEKNQVCKIKIYTILWFFSCSCCFVNCTDGYQRFLSTCFNFATANKIWAEQYWIDILSTFCNVLDECKSDPEHLYHWRGYDVAWFIQILKCRIYLMYLPDASKNLCFHQCTILYS